MALPSSGNPISFNNVRTEMSQSDLPDYSFLAWSHGFNYAEGPTYTPINILSSGTRWADTNDSSPRKMANINFSMSMWHDYDRTAHLNTDTTGVLYPHVENTLNFIQTATMIPYHIGTDSRNITINFSESLVTDYIDTVYTLDAWYGKPWEKNGAFVFGGLGGDASNIANVRTHVTWSYGDVIGTYTHSFNLSYEWNYTHNSNIGEYLYIVLTQYNGGCLDC